MAVRLPAACDSAARSLLLERAAATTTTTTTTPAPHPSHPSHPSRPPSTRPMRPMRPPSSATPSAAVGPPMHALRFDQARKLSAFLAQGAADAPPRLTAESGVGDLIAAGCTAALLRAADVQPACLIRAGATLSQLRQIGYDALDLSASPLLCGALVSAFGKPATAAAFLKSPDDAVALAASEAQRLLGVSARQLVKTCAGAREHATAVLQQLSLRHAARAPAGATDATDATAAHHWLTAMTAADLCSAGVDAQLLERLGVDPLQLPTLLGLDVVKDEAALASLGILHAR